MTLRKARWRDVLRIWRWRNHPSTRAGMRNTKRIGLLEHIRWFWRVRRCPEVALYFAQWGRLAVGVGRLDFRGVGDGTLRLIAEMDVTIAPHLRHSGLGTELITLLAEAARALGACRVYAVIRDDNRASLRAFARARFVGVPPGPVQVDHGFQVMEHRL